MTTSHFFKWLRDMCNRIICLMRSRHVDYGKLNRIALSQQDLKINNNKPHKKQEFFTLKIQL